MDLKYGFMACHFICLVFQWLPYVSSVHAVNCSLSHLPLCSSSVGKANKLDCFRLLDKPKAQCVWEPGPSTNISRFKLLIEAPNRSRKQTCSEYDIRGTSVELKSLRQTGNMTAFVAERGSNCTMAIFKGSLEQFFRCTAVNVDLQWRSGQLSVKASWTKGNDVQNYLVNYREYSRNNSKMFSTELSQHEQTQTISNLNSSVSYEVQVQCISTSKCTQCTPSSVFIVPQELTKPPIIKCTLDGFHQERRKVVISWESLSPQIVTQYSVRVQKESEEINETYTMRSSDSSISLYLSHSAYRVHLYSSNNVSQSPPATCTIEAAFKDMGIKDAFSVAFKSNHSFSLSWSVSLSERYECYTVEWLLKGGNATAFRSFYSDKNQTVVNFGGGTGHIASIKEAPFLPYKRYVFLLHVKSNRNIGCNLKHLNNSDVTCGWTEAYLLEGTPVSDPQNVSHSNVTDSSVSISWLPVPEEELRGFLQGYIIHYVSGNTKSNITLGPGTTNHTLSGLKSGRDYQVEVAAFTSKGEGKRSPPLYFGTNVSDHSGWMIILGGFIGTAVLLVAVNICFRLLTRVKEVLWPNIPNPSNSSAIQKINPGYELEPMMVTNGPKLQEHVDSGPLYLTVCSKVNPRNAEVDPLLVKQNCDASSLSFSNEAMAKPLNGMEKPGCLHSPEITMTEVGSTPLECASTELDSSGVLHTPLPSTEVAAATATATALGDCNARPTVTFMSDYTTMELFQQATTAVQAECHPCPPVSLMPKCFPPSGLDYVDQSHFCTP